MAESQYVTIRNPATGGIYRGQVSTSAVEPPAEGDLTTLTIENGAGGSQPFTAGVVFAKGAVPSGTEITSDVTQFQVDVRTRWPDDSAKFAVVSGVSAAGTATLSAGGTPYAGSNVAEPSVEAVVAFTSVVNSSAAAVAGGSFSASLATARSAGALSWSSTTAHKVRSILGPVMSEFHYFVPTTDVHTSVWFYVRAYVTGVTEVETVVENGWLNVASPDRRNYNATVTVGGTLRATLSSVVHYHHTRWSRCDWVGTDPQSLAKQDVQDLQATSIVPTYALTTLPSTAYSAHPDYGTKNSAMTRALAEQPTPFDLGSIDPSLGSGGDTDMYGLVPGWGATYLCEGHTGTFWNCIANGRAMGHFCTHYRDEADGRPFRGSAHLTMGVPDTNAGLSDNQGNFAILTPTPAGGIPSPYCKFSHSPAAAFMAALLSGRWSMIEELQFVVAAGELNTGMVYNGFRVGAWWDQNRTQGWKYRDRFQAEALTPSEIRGSAVTGADANQRTEAVGRITSSIELDYDYYVSGVLTSSPTCARGNAFGLPYQEADFDFVGTSNADGEHGYGGLQNGIYITTHLYAFDMEPAVTSPTQSKLQALAEHFGKWPVGQLGAQPSGSDWNWRVCCFVTLGYGSPGATSSGDGANGGTTYRASWNANWAAIQSQTAYIWGATDTFPTPPSDNVLYKIEMANVSPWLRMRALTSFTADTDVCMFCTAANYAHKVADRCTITGADTAITRLHGSDTWAHGLANLMQTRPDFAVISDRAATTDDLPSWVPTTVGEAAMVTMTNTLEDVMSNGVWSGSPAGQAICQYSGGVYNRYYGTWGAHVIHGGGHAASNDNSVFIANYNTRAFARVGGPTVLSTDAAYMTAIHTGTDNLSNYREVATNEPGSLHSYDTLVLLNPTHSGDALGGLLRPVAGAVGRGTVSLDPRECGRSHLFKFTTNTWERFSTTSYAQSWSPGGTCCYDEARGKVWPLSDVNATWRPMLDVTTGTFTNYSGYDGFGSNSYPDMMYSAKHIARDIIVICTNNYSSTKAYFYWFDASTDGSTRSAVTFSSGDLPLLNDGNASLMYCEDTQKLILWTGEDEDAYYWITVPVSPSSSWTWERIAITGAGRSSLLSPAPSTSTYKRMDYAPQLKSLMWVTGGSIASGIFGGRVVCIRVVA